MYTTYKVLRHSGSHAKGRPFRQKRRAFDKIQLEISIPFDATMQISINLGNSTGLRSLESVIPITRNRDWVIRKCLRSTCSTKATSSENYMCSLSNAPNHRRDFSRMHSPWAWYNSRYSIVRAILRSVATPFSAFAEVKTFCV